LTPPIMRSVLPVEPIKKLFLMMLDEELGDAQQYAIRLQEDSNYLYALITSVDLHFHETLHLEPYGGKIATCLVPQTDCFSFGLIFRNPTTQESLSLRLAIEQIMAVPI